VHRNLKKLLLLKRDEHMIIMDKNNR